VLSSPAVSRPAGIGDIQTFFPGRGEKYHLRGFKSNKTGDECLGEKKKAGGVIISRV